MTVSIPAFMMYFMLVEATLILALLLPCRCLNRLLVRFVRGLFSNSCSPIFYSIFSMVALFCTINLYSAYTRYLRMKGEGKMKVPDYEFYKSQRDLYLNGLTLYLWIVVIGLMSLHERYTRVERAAREEKKNQ
mmetsp:Transcript_43144/g.70124  ORF Transcript_43144/g.70124 Transcript_43144/m.70124 type:complete len:133 (-) Transcript_43144:189-587(-)|eukprot:jgi/Bigna1/90628/estExt_fgenesh1_pg.C_750032